MDQWKDYLWESYCEDEKCPESGSKMKMQAGRGEEGRDCFKIGTGEQIMQHAWVVRFRQNFSQRFLKEIVSWGKWELIVVVVIIIIIIIIIIVTTITITDHKAVRTVSDPQVQSHELKFLFL